jgi:dTDP-4-amino-4,6-dideoxygalactose transaminase
MWVRKEIEISPVDIVRGLGYCGWVNSRKKTIERLGRLFGGDQLFPCLSVRSGFDQLLRACDWPAHSEVIMSGLTIPDMPRIVRDHRLRPVGVDLDFDSLGPRIEELRAAITPRSKAIVVAHLFGGLVDLEPIAAVAREHGLLLIEDCAQAYVGNHFRGHSQADVSMFSFGPIKTNTALGGGLFIVRSEQMLRRLNQVHEELPVQSRLGFARRLLKYSYVRMLSTRLVSELIVRGLRWCGSDHDQLATKMARGFPGPRFFQKIRHQPSSPLLQLLARKLECFSEGYIQRRVRRGNQVADRLRSRVDVLGSEMIRPTYWVLPILVENRRQLVEQLWRLGFDATTSSSLKPVGLDLDDVSLESKKDKRLVNCRFILDHLVFLPFDLSIPDPHVEVMVRTVLQGEFARPARPVVQKPAAVTAG